MGRGRQGVREDEEALHELRLSQCWWIPAQIRQCEGIERKNTAKGQQGTERGRGLFCKQYHQRLVWGVRVYLPSEILGKHQGDTDAKERGIRFQCSVARLGKSSIIVGRGWAWVSGIKCIKTIKSGICCSNWRMKCMNEQNTEYINGDLWHIL